MKIFLYAFEFFMAKRLHIGLLAFIIPGFFRSMKQFSVDISPLAPVISFLIVWAAYLENLTTDKKEDSLGAVPHGVSLALESRLYPIEKFYPFIYLLALIFAWSESMKCFLYTVLAIIVFSSYVQPIFYSKEKKRRFRLKEIYVVKNLIPPMGWVLSVGVIPFVTTHSVWIPEYNFGLIGALIWSFREEIKYDIPDAEGDKKAGIKTFPNVLGEKRTKLILTFINFTLQVLFFTCLFLLKRNNRTLQLDAAFYYMYPFLASFFYDYQFSNLLFEKRKKEYCNIGVLWWDILLILFLGIPWPVNIVIFLFLRFSGGLLATSTSAVDAFLDVLKSAEDKYFRVKA
jgi:4-hydroxybenzoate polyprenyltransferase